MIIMVIICKNSDDLQHTNSCQHITPDNHFPFDEALAKYKDIEQQENSHDYGMFVIMRIFSISCGNDVNTCTEKDVEFCQNRLNY